MRNLNKLASAFCVAALGLLTLTGCEGADMYNIGAPDWIAEKVDSIKQAQSGGDEPILENMMEDVYAVGNADYSIGWWAAFSKYYQVPAGEKWHLQFNLGINPAAPNTYKNFALILCNDEDRGAGDYKEYGAIRYDNQPSGNSEWGDYIDRSLIQSNLTFETDTDAGIDKLAGKVTLTIDRTEGFVVTMTNGTVTKTYTQATDMPNLNTDPTNENIRAFLVPEGSYLSILATNIEPIGGCTSAEDKQPESMEVSGVPSEILLGTELSEALANVTATVYFEQGVVKNVTAENLVFQAIPNYNELGTKTLVIMYNKTFKGENCDKPISVVKTFNVVNELSAFTETVVVPTPNKLGTPDCSAAWWTAFTDNIKVEPKETKVVNFTNYTSGANNWNNYVIILNAADISKEYAVVRADNYGWGDGYAACTATTTVSDWATWLAAMNGAKVTAYITNNGDGTANIKAVAVGNDGVEYVQEYSGINTIDPENFYFRFTVDGSYLEFDKELGTPDCSAAWWTVFTRNVQIPSHTICTVNFTNYSSGAGNWNNYVVILNQKDITKEYAVVRADNYGWGNGYAACTPTTTVTDWATWLTAMNGAKVSMTIANKGDGTVDITAVAKGTDGVEYTQTYTGINTIDPDDLYVRYTVDGSYLVFE